MCRFEISVKFWVLSCTPLILVWISILGGKYPLNYRLELDFWFWPLNFLAKVYYANLHSPFEGWFTLFTLPFTLFEGWITLLEGWMSFWKEDSPFKKGERIHPWGWITLLEGWITLKKGESPFWRVNRQEVWVEKGWMKGESPFSRVNEKRVNRIRVNEGWMKTLQRL